METAEEPGAEERHAFAGVNPGLELVGLSLGNPSGRESCVYLVDRGGLGRVAQLVARYAEVFRDRVEEGGGRGRGIPGRCNRRTSARRDRASDGCDRQGAF